jgi:tRNA threonylcarbamoyladenosine biosynthesis protein TsaE
MDLRYTLADVPTVATTILNLYGAGRTYALMGELGSGKTTLVAELCRKLGVTDPVSSPTYAIVNEYAGAEKKVYHLDCYRLETVEEAIDAGLEELLAESGRTVFVEWPRVIEPLLPPGVVFLRLRHDPGGEAGRRQLTITTEQPAASD